MAASGIRSKVIEPPHPASRVSLETRTALYKAFARNGLLLKQDPRLPDVVGFLSGGPIRGSWWSHPGAHALFDALQEFAAGPDLIAAKLVGGKDTFVHRRLWPALLGAAQENAAWQREGLSPAAEDLMDALESEGPVEAVGPAAKEILARLLCHGRPFHTPRGRHALLLEPWSEWQRRKRVKPIPAVEARSELEGALEALGGRADLLPWHRARKTVRKRG